MLFVPHANTGVRYCLFTTRAFQSLYENKLINLTLSFYDNRTLEVDERSK